MSIKIHRVAAFALATCYHFLGPAPRTRAAMTQQRQETDTLVVTASPITQDRSYLATIVDSVDRSQILQSGGANLADALANEPGVTGTGFASGASRPVIRGFDANRVRVLENGIGSFDVSDVGPDHGVPIDPLSTQRIELVRGAATLRYGSQAIGGVVNAINNRVPEIVAGQTRDRGGHRRLRQRRRLPRRLRAARRARGRFRDSRRRLRSARGRLLDPGRHAARTRTSTAMATRSAARTSSATTTSASARCTTTRNTASRATPRTST